MLDYSSTNSWQRRTQRHCIPSFLQSMIKTCSHPASQCMRWKAFNSWQVNKKLNTWGNKEPIKSPSRCFPPHTRKTGIILSKCLISVPPCTPTASQRLSVERDYPPKTSFRVGARRRQVIICEGGTFHQPRCIGNKDTCISCRKSAAQSVRHLERSAPAGRDGHLQNTATAACEAGNSWSAHSVCLFVSAFHLTTALTICHCGCGRSKL